MVTQQYILQYYAQDDIIKLHMPEIIIQNLHVNNLYVGEGFNQAAKDIVASQVEAGASGESLRDMGYTDAPDQMEVAEPISPEEQLELDQIRAESIIASVSEADIRDSSRRAYLKKMQPHVSQIRKRFGHMVNRDRPPEVRGAIELLLARNEAAAQRLMKLACDNCVFAQKGCSISYDVEKWIDKHPYAVGKAVNKRPGSIVEGKVESRRTFIKALDKDINIHCDPDKR
jgi:hypothetical protein